MKQTAATGDTPAKKETRVVIYAICRTTTSYKYKFATENQELDKHPDRVKNAIDAANVKSKRHVDYTLKDEDVEFYIDPESSQFWFNSKQLERIAAKMVSDSPSVDKPDEPTPTTSRSIGGSSLQRQAALDQCKSILRNFSSKL